MPTGPAGPPAPARAAPAPAAEWRSWARIAGAFKQCLSRADHAGLCGLVLSAGPMTLPNWAIGPLLGAALATADEAALQAAIAHARAAPLRQAQRARLALALVRHRRAPLAAELLGDLPESASDAGEAGEDPAARPLLLLALAAMTLDDTAPPALRRWAAERRRAASRVVEGGFATADIRPRRQPPSPSLAPKGGIALAPGLEPGCATALLAALDRRAAADSAPQPAARVRIYRDVRANRLGAIWTRDGTVLREPLPSAEPLPTGEVPGEPVHERAILATGNTNNLYHRFGGIFRGLGWRFEPGAEALPVALRDDALPAQAQSLRLLGGHELPLIAMGESAWFRELLVPDWFGLGMHEGGAARFLYDGVVAAAGRAVGTAGGRRIFISRRDARARRPEREDALEAAFARHGFESVVLKGLPLRERILMMQDASAVAGIHGAGLTMLLAARPGTPVYEIMPWMPGSLGTRCCMAAISGAFGLIHRVWIEPCDEAGQAWTPHVDAIEEDLAAFLDGRSGPRGVPPGLAA